MTASSRIHQEISSNLSVKIKTFLIENKSKCKMFYAPFDVRLPAENETDDKDVSTVVQPDILVVCDAGKLDDKGMKGSPDFIIEILSPSTADKDNVQKLALYEENGVTEYWIVDPLHRFIRGYLLEEDGKYPRERCYARTNKLEVKNLPGLTIDLEDIFEEEELI